MSSISIDRQGSPGKSDAEIAAAIAHKYGYIAIVRYKSSANATEFSNFGTCQTEQEIRSYLNSPYCHDAEVVYDGRATPLRITAELILAGHCALCDQRATQTSLQLGAGNDFYICPQCALMCCDDCYPRLPLNQSPGYGTCPKCRIEMQRAIPGFYGRQSGTLAAQTSSTANTEPTPPTAIEAGLTLPDAIIQENLDTVRALITRGGDLQATDDDGATPLHRAAYMRNAEIAKLQLHSGARVDAQDAKGRTPLHEAAGHLHGDGDDALMRALLEGGASPAACDHSGATPLHLAAIGGHVQAAKMLLDHGAEIEARSQQLTPLHFQ